MRKFLIDIPQNQFILYNFLQNICVFNDNESEGKNILFLSSDENSIEFNKME